MSIKILLFTAEWCKPCRQVKPIIQELAKEYVLKFQEVDVDRDGNIPVRYGVMGVPCLVLLHGEEVVDMVHGVKPKSFYRRVIEGRLDSRWPFPQGLSGL